MPINDELQAALFQVKTAVKPFLTLSKLDESLDKVVGLVQQQDELTKVVAGLREQKVALEGNIATLQAEYERQTGDALRAIQKAEQDKAEQVARTTAETSRIRQEAAAAVAALTTEKANAAQEIKAAVNAKQKNIDEQVAILVGEAAATKTALAAEIQALEERRAELIHEITDMKERAANL